MSAASREDVSVLLQEITCIRANRQIEGLFVGGRLRRKTVCCSEELGVIRPTDCLGRCKDLRLRLSNAKTVKQSHKVRFL